MTRRFAAALAAIEPVEYPLALLPGHAGAGVAHPQERAAAGHASLDPHPAARWRELDCVIDQVGHGFAHEILVAANRQGRHGVNDHIHSLRFCQRLVEIEHLGANRAQVEVLELRLSRAILDRGDSQDRRNRRGHLFDLAESSLQGLAQLFDSRLVV